MPIDITNDVIEKIILASLLAVIPTWLIMRLGDIKKIFKSLFISNPQDMDKMIQSCYTFFPIENIIFHEKTFTRGMTVRITTSKNKRFVGKLIGKNDENMVCILTNRYIIAHELSRLTDMEEV